MENQNAPAGTFDQIYSFFLQLNRIHSTMPFCPLLSMERQELGGHLFPDGPGLVATVAAAMTAQPRLFPFASFSGAQLDTEQQLVYVWCVVRDCLRAMAQLASDTYLKLQSEAIQKALWVVRKAREQSAAEPATPERNLILIPAYFIVNDYYKGLHSKKARNKEQRQAAAVAASPAPHQPAQPPRKPPQRPRGDKARREQHQAGFVASFHKVLAADRPAHQPGPATLRGGPLPQARFTGPAGAPADPLRDLGNLTDEELLSAMPAEARARLRRLLA